MPVPSGRSDILEHREAPRPAPSGAGPPRDPLADEGPAVSRGQAWFFLLAITLGILSILWVIQDEVVNSSIQVGNISMEASTWIRRFPT